MKRIANGPDLHGAAVGFAPEDPDHPVCLAIDEVRLLLSLEDVVHLTKAMARCVEIAVGLQPRPQVGVLTDAPPDEIVDAARANRPPPVQ